MEKQNRPRWDDHEWPGLPPLTGDAEAEVCVVGLGGTGLTCITEALALGAKSLIGIDAADVAAGAAGRNGGFLLAGTADFHHDAVTMLGRERAVAITRLTLDEMQRMAREVPGAVRFPGSVRIAASSEEVEDCDRQRRQMLADGLAVEPYVGPEGRGLLIPTDGVFHPIRRCRTVAARALEQGARLHGRTTAREITSGRVRTDGGTIHARHVIVCVDGRLELLVPDLAGAVRTARLQMLATAPAPEVSYPRAVYKRYGYDYWQQLLDGSIVFGGGRDTTPETEWTTDSAPSDAIQDYLTRTLRDDLKVTAEVTHRWAASVSFTETGLPVFRDMGDGLTVMGGYSGTGNVVGAVLGRAAAQRAIRGTSELAAPFIG
ncbi:MAG: NAD(P)/FAD-dependent oxidoreductase [Gemmatimonadaceae bacterium]